MGFWARIFRRERSVREEGHYGTVAFDRQFDREGKPISIRRVEVPAKKTREELIQELEKSYHEVVDLVSKVKAHLDRHESRADRLMEVLERIDTLHPRVADLPDRLASELSGHAERLDAAIATSRQCQIDLTRQLDGAISGLADEVRNEVRIQSEMSSALTDMQSNLISIAQSGKQSSSSLQSILDRQDGRDRELGVLLVQARGSFTVALYVGLAMGAIALAVACIALVEVFSRA